MARKKKALDQNVLEVLSGLEVDGRTIRIATQLDRKMYLRVNEVLAELGGVWNTKAGVHQFEHEPQEGLDRVITTGELERAADLGFFATPEPLAVALVGMADIEPGQTVLEPSAGEGALLGPILERKPKSVLAVEIDPVRVSKLRDRSDHLAQVDVVRADFTTSTFARHHCVVMNPPFVKVEGHDHLDHVRHAYAHLLPKGILVSVLPASVSFRQDTRHREFRDWYKARHGKLTDLPEGSFKASGTGVRTCVLKMHKGNSE